MGSIGLFLQKNISTAVFFPTVSFFDIKMFLLLIRSSTLPERFRPCQWISGFCSLPSSIPPHSPPTSTIAEYLKETLGFSEHNAKYACKHISPHKNLTDVLPAISLFREYGLSDPQIASCIRSYPRIMVSSVKNTIAPKLRFFQDLAASGPLLGFLISRNASLLKFSLSKRIIPATDILRQILSEDGNRGDVNKDIVGILCRSKWILLRDPKSVLERNVLYLQSCGIVGSQLSGLLKWQQWLFVAKEPTLRSIVSRTVAMGFSVNSKMFVHALHSVSSLRPECIDRKVRFLRKLGFSKDDCLTMFKRMPSLMRVSESKMKSCVEFFVKKFCSGLTMLIRNPMFLMFSLENRTMPRYMVLTFLVSRQRLKILPSFSYMLRLTEAEFERMFILGFKDCGEELIAIYHTREERSSSCRKKREGLINLYYTTQEE